MGRCFIQSFIILLIIHCVRTILCFRDLLESTLNILMDSSGGSNAISQKSLGMSSPIGLDSASASIFIFPAIWMILKS